MRPNIKSEKLKIGGMTCVSCENRIRKKLIQLPGIEKVNVNYNYGTAEIFYDVNVIELEKIIHNIEDLEYKVIRKKSNVTQKFDSTRVIGAVFIIFAVYMIMRRTGISNIFNQFPQAEEGMGYGMLFLIGLLTSVHCIAMCGGINISQCMPQTSKCSAKKGVMAALRPSILYNIGRVISYTLIGTVVGALGSVISFSGEAKGIVQIAAGVFMVIMGLNMLNVFPGLRKLTPRLPNVIRNIIPTGEDSNSPLYVGLLNGLMPCGPLQAMQLYALSTGDPIKGGVSMFLFSLGTVPLMFGIGAVSSLLSQKFTKRVMSVGAVLVIILGTSMFSSGLSLSGLSMAPTSLTSETKENKAVLQDGIQVVNTSLDSGRYEPITVQAGVPVKWTIAARDGTINGCNNRMFISEYGIEKKFEIGDNVVEFTPTTPGVYTYSCWMGMIRSTITVEE